MSFGKKKKEKNVTQALQPTNFNSPYGSVTTNRNGVNFDPNLSPDQLQAQSLTDSKILQALSQIPASYDVNTAFNNPFYNQLAQSYRQPIDTDKQNDFRDLTNQLNAQNQLGSSYDALQRDLLGRRYDQRYANADSQARLGSFDAYNQSLSNNLQALAALRNDRTAGLDATYSPLKYALSYQSALNPLSQSAASFYANQPTGLQGALGNVSATAQAGSSLLDFFKKFNI